MSDGAALFELTPQQQEDLLETMLALKLETLTGPWTPLLTEALEIVGGLSLEQVTLIALRCVQAAVEVGSIAIGVPPGGTTGQALVKASNADFATVWETIAGGPGGGIPEAPTTGLIYGRQGSTTSWQLVLPLTGGTLTGPLILAADPSTNLGAATKQYVDATVADQAIFEGVYRISLNQPDLRVTTGNRDGYYWDAITVDPQVPDATVVALPGIPLGTLINNDDRIIWVSGLAQYQIITGGALTQPYADTLYLSLSGGTLTGPLTLPGDPTQALQAATKQYVDAHGVPTLTPLQVLWGSIARPGEMAWAPWLAVDTTQQSLTVGQATQIHLLPRPATPNETDFAINTRPDPADATGATWIYDDPAQDVFDISFSQQSHAYGFYWAPAGGGNPVTFTPLLLMSSPAFSGGAVFAIRGRAQTITGVAPGQFLGRFRHVVSAARVQLSSNMGVPGGPGVWQGIPWNSLPYDDDGIWQAPNFVAPIAGIYHIVLSVAFEPPLTSDVLYAIYHNAGPVTVGTAFATYTYTPAIAADVLCAAGDAISGQVFTAEAITMMQYYTSMSIHYVGELPAGPAQDLPKDLPSPKSGRRVRQ